MSKFKAIGLITEAFDRKKIKYDVNSIGEFEEIRAGFSVDDGPFVEARFVSTDDDNDVGVRVFGLVSNIRKSKRARVMAVCNYLNRKKRYLKYYVDKDGDVNAEYDFLLELKDDCVGEVAFEIFFRFMKQLDDNFVLFAKALYTDDPIEVDGETIMVCEDESAESEEDEDVDIEDLSAELDELSAELDRVIREGVEQGIFSYEDFLRMGQEETDADLVDDEFVDDESDEAV